MLRIAFALAATALIASPPAMAAPCKDAKGKFIKCPAVAAPAAKPAAKPLAAAKVTTKTAPATGKKAPCRDAKGRFKKC